MLDSEITKKIEDLVYQKPRSIQEIAIHVKKNWRTADRYVQEIEKNFGTISTRVFREGTKGALKIVYWASIERVSYSIFQKLLEEQIMVVRKKEDFSAFDIYQHIDDNKKRATLEKGTNENQTNLQDLIELLEKTQKQLLIFSGNLSFINLKNKTIDVFKIIEALVKKGVIIKVICRVDIAGRENIEKLLSLNFKYGKENIEIRHREHPLRAIIFDNKFFRIKEIKEPTGKINELNKKIYIFYTIKDKEWTEWLSRVFWKLFSNSVNAQKRIKELKKLE